MYFVHTVADTDEQQRRRDQPIITMPENMYR